MRNIARVFLRDVKRLLHAPAAWSVVLFLILLPSLYTWFNVAAFWNPYDNTGALRVCVVNEDAGADDEKLGHLDVGATLVEQLQDNDQLDWTFVTRDEAIEEVSSGKAYAAFAIPESFSADIATLTTGNFVQPTLEYYVNEKTGPVSPKITDTGANALDTTINDTFFSIASSTVVDMLNAKIDETRVNAETARNKASTKLDNAIASLESTQTTIADLSAKATAMRDEVSSAKAALGEASQLAANAMDRVNRAGALVGQSTSGLATAAAAISTALDSGAVQMAKAVSQANVALAQTGATIEAAKAALGVPSDGGGLATPDYSQLIALLEQLKTGADDSQKARIDDAIATLKAAPTISDDWNQLAAALDSAASSAESSTDALTALAGQIVASTEEYQNTIGNVAVPAIGAEIADIAAVSGDLNAAAEGLYLVVDQAQAVLDDLDSTLAVSAEALSKTSSVLGGLKGDLSVVKTDLASLANADALSKLFGENGLDPDKVADFMMSPTQVKREELYPLNAYGSAMAPLFINLTLWIGVFMLMVIFRLEVDDTGIENLTITQRTFGRGLLLAIIAALQAIVCCVGCLVIGVQTANAAVFILTAVIASLAYLAVQYTLSTTLQHVGKALCIILVMVQIPAATGLYPIEMTTDFFRTIYPVFPFTYGINAIRETIGGFYDGAWAGYIGMLLAFMVGFIAVGTIARPYMTNLNRLFAREIEESDIIIGEAMQLPARRYRMSQLLRAMSDHDDYRDAIQSRVNRFMALYPQLKQGALAVGVGFPVLATAIMAALGAEKVVVLTLWLVWFALVIGYLITVEYLHDYLNHLVSLDHMSDAEMRALVTERNRFTRVRPLQGSANFLAPSTATPPTRNAGEADDASDAVEAAGESKEAGDE